MAVEAKDRMEKNKERREHIAQPKLNEERVGEKGPAMTTWGKVVMHSDGPACSFASWYSTEASVVFLSIPRHSLLFSREYPIFTRRRQTDKEQHRKSFEVSFSCKVDGQIRR
jgi:hypothetical protein